MGVSFMTTPPSDGPRSTALALVRHFYENQPATLVPPNLDTVYYDGEASFSRSVSDRPSRMTRARETSGERQGTTSMEKAKDGGGEWCLS